MTAAVVVVSLASLYMALGCTLVRAACRRADRARAWGWWEGRGR